MMVVGNRRVWGGFDIVGGRVTSEGQWGFVLVVERTHGKDDDFGWELGRERLIVFLLVLARLLCAFGRSFFVGVSAIEVGDKFWGVFQMLHGLPRTVARGESLPLDKVMKLAPSALSADFLYFFGFVLLFSIDTVRWRSGEVRAVQRRLLLWCEGFGVDYR